MAIGRVESAAPIANLAAAAEVGAILRELEHANPLSRGLLLPDGTGVPTDTVHRVLGFVPGWTMANASIAAKLEG